MNTDEKKKIAELEKDIKKMQKDHRRTFAEFEHKKSLSERVTDRLKRYLLDNYCERAVV